MRRPCIIVIVVLMALIHADRVPAQENPISEAWELVKTKRPYNAIVRLNSYVPGDAERAVYHYVYGRGMLGIKRYREAIDHLNEAYIFADEKDLKESALFYRGVAYLRGGFSYEAALNFRSFMKRFPDSVYMKDAYAYYARASLNSNDFINALKYYKLAGDTPDALFGKAEVFHRLGLYSTASRVYARAILKYRNYLRQHVEALYYYVENLRKTGDAEDSKKLLYLLMETPYRDRAFLSMGLIDFESGQYDSAAMHLKRCLQSTERAVRRQAMLTLAKVYIRQGLPEKALRLLGQLRMTFPYTNENREGLVLLAGILMDMEDFRGAMSALREVLFSSRPTQEAVEMLRRLVEASMESSPEDFLEIWKRCGIWLLDEKHQDILLRVALRLEKAGGDFIRIYRYLAKYGDSNSKIQALSRLAIFYADFGEYNIASEYLQKVERMGVSNDDLLRLRARLYYAGGRKDLAFNTLRMIRRPDEDDIVLLWRCGSASGDVTDYLSAYRNIVKSTNLSPEYTEMADLLYRKRRSSDAMKYYRLALTIDPENEWALYRLGRLSPAGPELASLAEKGHLLGRAARVLRKEEHVRLLMEEVLGGV